MKADEFRSCRKALELSQRGLADKLDVTRETVIRWEAGEPAAHRGMRDLAMWALWRQDKDAEEAGHATARLKTGHLECEAVS